MAYGGKDLQAWTNLDYVSSYSDTSRYETGANAENTVPPEIVPKEAYSNVALASGETLWRVKILLHTLMEEPVQ